MGKGATNGAKYFVEHPADLRVLGRRAASKDLRSAALETFKIYHPGTEKTRRWWSGYGRQPNSFERAQSLHRVAPASALLEEQVQDPLS